MNEFGEIELGQEKVPVDIKVKVEADEVFETEVVVGLKEVESDDKSSESENNTQSQGESDDLDEEIKNYNEEKFKSLNMCMVILLTFNVSTGYLFFGYHLAVFNTIQVQMKKIFGWTEEETNTYYSVCSMVIPLGALFGGAISGKIASLKIGRKGSFILFQFIGLFGSLISIIGNTPSFIIGRFIVGFCVGAFSTIVPLYIQEYVPSNLVGTCGMIYNTLFGTGILIAFVLGLGMPNEKEVTSDDSWWRLMMLFPSILGAFSILVFLFAFTKDTPKFLYLCKNDIQGAEEALKVIYRDEKEINEILAHLERVKRHLNKHNDTVTYSQLFCGKYKIRMVISIIMNFGQQMSALNVFGFYSNMVYLQGEPKVNATLYSTFSAVAEVVATISAVFFVEKLGRRVLLLIGFFSAFSCLLSITILYYLNIVWPQKFIVIILFLFVGISVDPLIWIINADLLPDIGVGICTSINWIAAILIVITFPYMMASSLALAGSFLIYSILTFLLVIFIFFFFKETRNKTHMEIDREYSSWF